MGAMQTRGLLYGSFVSVALLAGACGGAPKPALEAQSKAGPTSDTNDKAGDKPEAEKADAAKPDAAKPDAAKDAAKPSAPADDGPKPTRTTQDILTAPDVVFLFD